MLSYCTKCGAKLKEDDKFCYVCGAPTAKVVTKEYSVKSDDLIERVRELLHEGNVTRVIVKDNQGKVLLEIPALRLSNFVSLVCCLSLGLSDSMSLGCCL